MEGIMSKVIKLPSGNTATLRDPSTLKHKDRKKMVAAANNQEGMLQTLSMVDGLIAVLVEEWSFDLIIPSIHLASLDELSITDYDALAKEANALQESISPTYANQETLDSPLDNSNA
mgnify:CR=1 FL=1